MPAQGSLAVTRCQGLLFKIANALSSRVGREVSLWNTESVSAPPRPRRHIALVTINGEREGPRTGMFATRTTSSIHALTSMTLTGVRNPCSRKPRQHLLPSNKTCCFRGHQTGAENRHKNRSHRLPQWRDELAGLTKCCLVPVRHAFPVTIQHKNKTKNHHGPRYNPSD